MSNFRALQNHYGHSNWPTVQDVWQVIKEIWRNCKHNRYGQPCFFIAIYEIISCPSTRTVLQFIFIKASWSCTQSWLAAKKQQAFDVDFLNKILFSALCLHISDFEVMSTSKIGLKVPKSDIGKLIAIWKIECRCWFIKQNSFFSIMSSYF